MYTKTELEAIAKKQELVYVVDEDSLSIIDYPTANIEFNMGRRAIFDLGSSCGEIKVFDTKLAAEEYLLEIVEYEIEVARERYDTRIKLLNSLKTRYSKGI